MKPRVWSRSLWSIFVYIFIFYFSLFNLSIQKAKVSMFIEHFGFSCQRILCVKLGLLVVHSRRANMMSYSMGLFIGILPRIYPKSKYNAFTLSICLPNNSIALNVKDNCPQSILWTAIIRFEKIWLLSTQFHKHDSRWFAQTVNLVEILPKNPGNQRKKIIKVYRFIQLNSILQRPQQNQPTNQRSDRSGLWHGAPWKAPF